MDTATAKPWLDWDKIWPDWDKNYCFTCAHHDTNVYDEPCRNCCVEPLNTETREPVHYVYKYGEK